MPKYDLWGHKDLDIEIPKDVFAEETWLEERDELFGNPEHGYFESSHEGKKLHYRKNLPPEGTPVRAILVYQHGIHGQSGFGTRCPSDGRYTDMAMRVRTMTSRGFVLYAHDQLGHGFSEGRRFYIPGGDWTVNRDDLVKFTGLAASEHPEGTPLFLMGESYGGCLAFHASHALSESGTAPGGFRGCALSCPALDGDIPAWPVKYFLMYVLKPMAPTWTPFFMPHPITAERIWKEKECREAMMDKTHEHGLSNNGVAFSLGTATGLVKAMEAAQALFADFSVPFHINHGSDDYGVPASGSQELFRLCKTPPAEKALNIVSGGYHALYSQLDAVETMNHEIEWIEKMIKAEK